ncbi:MAG: hypothetical protein ABJV68_06860 [Paracoccaceae bacterium]
MMGTLLLNVAVSSAGFALGGVYLKRYADMGGWYDLGAAFLVFGCSNLVYAQVLAKGLGSGAALSSMAHLVIMSAVGVLMFGERLGIYQISGLIMALMSIWLFSNAIHSTG